MKQTQQKNPLPQQNPTKKQLLRMMIWRYRKMHLQEKTIGSETTYLGKVFYVTKDTARLEDGAA